MKLPLFFLFFLSFLFLSWCWSPKDLSEKNPSIQTPVTQRIFVLWDSLSAGYQLPIEQSYPSVLERKLQSAWYQVKVINGGESGDTSAGLKERLTWITADAQSGDIALIVIGGNDGLQGLPLLELEKNISDITKILQSRHIYTIIGGMQIPSNLGVEYRKWFADIYARVATETKSVLVPFILSGVGGVPSLNLPDGIHPNASGQVLVAENVVPFVLDLLKK
jgi:acyl-CoA thioesterase I